MMVILITSLLRQPHGLQAIAELSFWNRGEVSTPFRLSIGRGPDCGLNEFPELGILFEGLVFVKFEAGAEVKILERVTAENAMYHHAELVPLEVNPVIAHTETMERAAGALELPELVEFGIHDLLRKAAKLAQNVELKFLGHAREFSGTDGIKDYLEGQHFVNAECGMRSAEWAQGYRMQDGKRTAISSCEFQISNAIKRRRKW
jgi:hypothetical protein